MNNEEGDAPQFVQLFYWLDQDMCFVVGGGQDDNPLLTAPTSSDDFDYDGAHIAIDRVESLSEAEHAACETALTFLCDQIP
jgi:hypothetical protein